MTLATAALDPGRLARALVASNSYLILATADSDGMPWASPVWFAARDLDSFVWASKPGARHSRNLAANPAVAITIFDSSRPPGDGSAVYASAVAEEVVGLDRDPALAVYNARSVERGLPQWSVEKLSGDAKHRIYRATVSGMWVLDDHDERLVVPLPS